MPLSYESRAPRPRPRAGFTIIEMVIVTMLLAVVGGTVMSMLAKQQAFYRSTSDVMDVRSQLRQASAVLTNDLRGVSSIGGDIQSMSESSIDFYYTIGSSVACATPTSVAVTLPPATLSNGNTLTDWVMRPARGDVAFLYNDTDTTTSTDDGWLSFTIDTLIASPALCNSTFTQTADNATDSYQLKVSSSGPAIPTTTVRKGATIRFARRVWYGLYQNTADNRWYLGYCSPTCTTANPAQPVAGPFNPLAIGTGTSGVRFRYFDQNGTEITGNTAADRASVALITITLRGQTRGQINVSGMGKGFYTDSLRTDVALRNRF